MDNLNRYLGRILACTLALSLSASGGPVMAQVVVDITIEGDLDATGGIGVQGDIVFKELDVNVQDSEVVTKFFELVNSASGTWSISGEGVMNAAEQFQNGLGNLADISQNPGGSPLDQMNVGLKYQIGNLNSSFTTQVPAGNLTNNFAKDIQIGAGNIGTTLQN